MFIISWKNLIREKSRLCVAVLGVVFAVVLVTVEIGMLLGMVRNASILIDRSPADIWVSVPKVKTFDFGTPMPRRKKYLIESTPGVELVEEFNISYSVWHLPNGGNANCQVIAMDERGQLAPRLPMLAGRMEALHNREAVIVDESALSKLGFPELGDQVEIVENRARLVGITKGLQSFSTMPFVFTALEKGPAYGMQLAPRKYGGGDASIYFLVRVQAGHSVEAVREAIQASVPGVEVQTRAGFSARTRHYWLVETGIGMGFLVAALLGLLVGGVIVSQTLYGMTSEKLGEFAVLKALGASMQQLSLLVIGQGLVCGLIGWIIGMGISKGIQGMAGSAGLAVEIPPALAAFVALSVSMLCIFASWISVAKLKHIEPASAFRI